jgi:cytochrome c biogenesis protein CcmG, thiol:disulfide interchange protein DsbE
VTVALAVLLALGLPDAPRPGIGDPAPALELEAPDGRPFARPRLDGETTIVDFFATWCVPCHRALADLAAARARLGAPTRLILVDVGEDAPTLKRFLAAHPLPPGAELALDRGGGTARRWGQERFPTTFLVDGAGIVRHINRGWGPGYEERVLRWLRATAAATSPPPRPATPRPGPTPAARTFVP